MEETTHDPLIESSLENGSQAFSEWKILLIPDGLSRVSLNVGFQNSDFRDSHQKSVVDPETYQKLVQGIAAAAQSLSLKRSLLIIPLYVGAILPVAAMHAFELPKWVVLLGLLAYIFLAAVTYHFVCEYLFKVADAQLIALVGSYPSQFLEEHGVELGHAKSTQTFRWWKDDSGIYLRRPRRPSEEEVSMVISHGSELERTFNPIFLLLTVPGDHVMDEITGDPAMKKARTLLQSTYKEKTKLPFLLDAFLRCCYLMLLVFIIAFPVWLVSQQNPFPVWVLVFSSRFNVFGCIRGALVYPLSRRRLAAYKEVVHSLNEAFQKDEELAHLAVEFHDSELPGYVPMASLRFQFVLRRADIALAVMV